MFKQMATDKGFELDVSDDPALFTDQNLVKYHAIAFLNTSGFFDPLLAQFESLFAGQFTKPDYRAYYHVAATVSDLFRHLEAGETAPVVAKWFTVPPAATNPNRRLACVRENVSAIRLQKTEMMSTLKVLTHTKKSAATQRSCCCSTVSNSP